VLQAFQKILGEHKCCSKSSGDQLERVSEVITKFSVQIYRCLLIGIALSFPSYVNA